jgi:predicted transcriptional regulator
MMDAKRFMKIMDGIEIHRVSRKYQPDEFYNALKKEPFGMTINQTAKKIGCTSTTATYYLYKLLNQRTIKYRKIANVRVYYVEER